VKERKEEEERESGWVQMSAQFSPGKLIHFIFNFLILMGL
jgi:hypothetical protein